MFATRALRLAVLPLVLAAVGVAQDAATAVPPIDLATLIARVRGAHWPKPPEQPLDRYKARLRFTPTRQDENSNQFDLTVAYLAPGLLRYKVEEPGQVLESGIDEKGPWSLVGEELQRLQGKERRAEGDKVRARLGLASQLLKVLDPAAVLSAMTDVTDPERGELPISQKERVPIWIVRGTLDDFPLQQPAEDGRTTARVQIAVKIHGARALVLAVESRMLDDEGVPTGPVEMVYLRYPETDIAPAGVALPTQLLLYRDRVQQARIEILAIDLAPDGVVPEAVRRPG